MGIASNKKLLPDYSQLFHNDKLDKNVILHKMCLMALRGLLTSKYT